MTTNPNKLEQQVEDIENIIKEYKDIYLKNIDDNTLAGVIQLLRTSWAAGCYWAERKYLYNDFK